jgi:hypothetical protein
MCTFDLYVFAVQVPKVINVGATVRELSVTVGNRGRDTAQEVTLLVTGTVKNNDGAVLVQVELGFNGTDSILETGANEPFDLTAEET